MTNNDWDRIRDHLEQKHGIAPAGDPLPKPVDTREEAPDEDQEAEEFYKMHGCSIDSIEGLMYQYGISWGDFYACGGGFYG